jgi:hypothetical protein
MPLLGSEAAPVVNILNTKLNMREDCLSKGLKKIPYTPEESQKMKRIEI